MNSESNQTASDKRVSKRFEGVVVPMVTPIFEKGRGDEKSLLRIVDHMATCGAEPFIFGTTGEASSISNDEKARLAKFLCREYGKRGKVYAGIAGNCFEESVGLAKRYADFGVDVAVANLPSYYPLEEAQILKYFEALADSIPLPLMIYNIPATTRMSIPIDVVDQLSEHENVVGLKDSERDEDRLKNAISRYKGRSDFSFFVGWAAQSADALILGADGLVPSSGNLIPQMYRDLYDAAISGDGALAQSLQEKSDAVSLIYQENRSLGSALAALKVLMNELGLCEKGMWPPLVEIDGNDEAELRERIRNALQP